MVLKEKAYIAIKDRIINCIYPPGSLLNGKQLIEELKLSRTPFRDAINSLAQENLLEIVPYKGIFVTEITIKDIENLYAIRDRLEPFAVELSIDNIPDDVLEACKESLLPYKDVDEHASKGKFDISVRKDEDLHRMLLSFVNNALLVRTMLGFYDHNHRIRVLSTNKDEIVTITRQQHLVIVECMCRRDKTGATEAMHRHIVSSKERAIDAMMAHKDRIYLK